MKTLTETITWHPIGHGCTKLPDVEMEVLVFDGHLVDTVKASMAINENDKPVWIEVDGYRPLQDPQWWADVPFPGANVG